MSEYNEMALKQFEQRGRQAYREGKTTKEAGLGFGYSGGKKAWLRGFYEEAKARNEHRNPETMKRQNDIMALDGGGRAVRYASASGVLTDVKLPGASEVISTDLDWFGLKKKKLQVVITPANQNENAVRVRFNDDGTIHSIVVSDDHMSKVRIEGAESDSWMEDRDGAPQ